MTDLRYLTFLLSSYSWTIVIFSVVSVLWIVSRDVSEITVGPLKIKTVVAFRSAISMTVIMFAFRGAISGIHNEIDREIALQQQHISNGVDASQDWKVLWDKMTHDLDYKVFNFLSINNKYDVNNDTTVKYVVYSIVQRFFFWLLLICPMLALVLEFFSVGSQHLSDKQMLYFVIFPLLIAISWFSGIETEYNSIENIILNISQLAKI